MLVVGLSNPSCCLKSEAIIFIIKFCGLSNQTDDFRCIIIDDGNVENDFNCDVVQKIPVDMSACSLPSALRDGILHAGLCSVARLIIQHAAKHIDGKYASLLGHNQVLLKANEDSSDWRHLCENLLPSAANDMELLKQHRLTQLECEFLVEKEILRELELKNFLSNFVIPNVVCVGVCISVLDLIVLPIICHLCVVHNFTLSDTVLRWLKVLHLNDRIKQTFVYFSFHQYVCSTSELYTSDYILSGNLLPTCPKLISNEFDDTAFSFDMHMDDILNDFHDFVINVFQSNDWPISLSEDITLDWAILPDHCNPSSTALSGKRLLRKQQQLESLLSVIRQIVKPGKIIVDFCSGSGHLGILLAHFFPFCQIYLVDNKLSSIEIAQKRCSSLSNVQLFNCSLNRFISHFDIGVCLHGCGVATDLVMAACNERKAAFVISPCCYGFIQNARSLRFPRSNALAHVAFPQYSALSKCADDIDRDCEHAMTAIDADRLQWALEQGYAHTFSTFMFPKTCSTKNHIIIGWQSGAV